MDNSVFLFLIGLLFAIYWVISTIVVTRIPTVTLLFSGTGRLITFHATFLLLTNEAFAQNLTTTTTTTTLTTIVPTSSTPSMSLEVCNFTGGAGCLCQYPNSTVSCVDSAGGAAFGKGGGIPIGTVGNYYGNLHCLSNPASSTYEASPDLTPLCPAVLGFCNPGRNVPCCKTAGCATCHPYEAGCSVFVPQNFSDKEWNTLKTFFDIGGFKQSKIDIKRIVLTLCIYKGCKTAFCNSLRTNRTCMPNTPPVICDGTGAVIEL